jgi:hypothetical protein
MRKEALNNVLAATINKRHKALLQQASAFVRKALLNTISKEVQEWLDSAPEGCRVDMVGSLSIYMKPDPSRNEHRWDDPVAKQRAELVTDRYYSSVTQISIIPVKIPPNYSHGYSVTLESKEELQAWAALAKKFDKLAEDTKKVWTTVKAALEACTTVKQVEERYPDLVQYLPETAPRTKALAVTNVAVVRVLACGKTGDKKDCK